MKKILLVLLALSSYAYSNRWFPTEIERETIVIQEELSKEEQKLAEVKRDVEFALEVEDFLYAERVVQEALKEFPNNELLRNKLVRIYTISGRYKESYDIIKKATILRVDSDTEEVIYDRRYSELFLYQVENLKRMIERENLNWRKEIYENEFFSYYETYLDIVDYRDSDAIYDLGNIYMTKERFQKAMEIFEKDRNRGYRNIFGAAVTSRYLGYYKKSIDYYESFIRLEPTMPEAYLGLAQAYQMNGEFEKAITYFDRYLKYDKNERVYVVMANIEIARERYGSARGILEEGQRAFPNSKTIGELLIEVYSRLGR